MGAIIPLWVLLIPYAIVLAVFVFFALINFYYLVRFGFLTFGSVLFFLLFVGSSAMVLLSTWQALAGVDWSAPLYVVGGGISDTGNFGI